MVALLVCLIVACASTSMGAHDLSSDYRFSATLDSDGVYQLFWNFDLDAETISFAVQVRTNGWVGFGLSPNGQMPGSDVVIGWVDGEGMTFFDDRYAEGRFLPPIDSSQDWFLVGGEEENGTTILEFTRKLTTCDDKDLDVQLGTSRVVWSWHSSDPADPNSITQHQFQGSSSLNLLGGLNEDVSDPPDADSFTINNVNLTIPDDSDTTYWCSAFRLPQEVEDQERFVYKMYPVISEGNSLYVHHVLVYICTSLSDVEVGTGAVCDSASENVSICRGEALLGAWAVGGSGTLFPEGVALPVGGSGKPVYVVMELHYDNPNLDSGVIDSSGMEFFYTNTEPTHRAGVLLIGHSVTNSMIIPPNARNFVVEGLCTSQCTQKFIPPEGITIFASGLHTHLAGHGLVLQHFRVNEECGVLEELPPVDEDLNYDFNYQQLNQLPSEVKVLPGDVLNLKCFYRTTYVEQSRLTLGGESTREEMCLAFAFYYPQIDFSLCLSFPTDSSFAPFAEKYIGSSERETLYNAVQHENETAIRETLGEVDWTLQAIQDFEASVLSSDLFGYCASTKDDFIHLTTHPETNCSYEAPDKCSGTDPTPCCETMGGGAYPTATVSVFMLLAVTVASISLKF